MLTNYLPKRTFAVTSAYSDDLIIPVIAAAEIQIDNSIQLNFPKVNPYPINTPVTLHLDNRTGVEAFDASLRVYRCSYKGVIVESDGNCALVRPLEYQLVYSTKLVESFQSTVFQYPPDTRPEIPLIETPLKQVALVDEEEHSNKLGVLITRAVRMPHTTVMAFLSTKQDDIFLISMRSTRKSMNLHRNADCCFAIDHRASYLFEKAVDWNYTILKGRAFKVSTTNPLFKKIQTQFIEKNPWELVFFSSPEIEMFHILPHEILCPEKLKSSETLVSANFSHREG